MINSISKMPPPIVNEYFFPSLNIRAWLDGPNMFEDFGYRSFDDMSKSNTEISIDGGPRIPWTEGLDVLVVRESQESGGSDRLDSYLVGGW